MSRPTQYVREEALEAAMQVFWTKGYHATSLKDLESRLRMKPGSIYGAFRSKQNLYILALEMYVSRSIDRFREQLEQAETALTGLAGYLRGFARLAPEDIACQVCMLTKTLVDVTNSDPEIAAKAKVLLAKNRLAFAAAFERAKSEGELSAEADCAHLARRFQGSIAALRFELHVATDQADVAALAEDLARDVEALRLPALQYPHS
jgi:AcrR family transcriptional regulator